MCVAVLCPGIWTPAFFRTAVRFAVQTSDGSTLLPVNLATFVGGQPRNLISWGISINVVAYAGRLRTKV